MAARNEDDEDVDPVRMILPDDGEHAKSSSSLWEDAAKEFVEKHYIPSVDSTLTIRRLPSQGLSFQLWPAATTLATLLDTHRRHPTDSPLGPTLRALADCDPLRVLELGSGTGLVGIAAAVTLGANVTVTDLPHVIHNLQHNIDRNADVLKLKGGAVDVASLRWGKAEDMEAIAGEYNLVLASDVVYHDHLYEPLIETLRFLLLGEGETEKKKKKKKKVVFVMAHLRRWKKESAFFRKAKKWFDVETIHTDSPLEGSRMGVAVYRFVGKGQNLMSGLGNGSC